MHRRPFTSLFISVLIVLFVFSVPVLLQAQTDAEGKITANSMGQADIEAFVQAGCPHCAEAEQFLKDLQTQQPGLRIVIHEVTQDSQALQRLKNLAESRHDESVRVPAFLIKGELIVGFSQMADSGGLIRRALGRNADRNGKLSENADSCGVESALECRAEPEQFNVNLLGHTITLEDVGLPFFTLVMGFLDGFNPCSLWVLILMISMLAPIQNRMRMLAITGIFVLVEGIAYFIFMAAWLNLFLLIGISKLSQFIIAGLAIAAGLINLKDYWAFGTGISLSIPASVKPNIYARMRAIMQAENLLGAMVAVVILAVLVQIVELMCTSGFPALYTRILTLRHMDTVSYYGFLLLYNLAYLFDDVVILLIGVVTLSSRRLQEHEGRLLKLLSGIVMLLLGLYLLFSSH